MVMVRIGRVVEPSVLEEALKKAAGKTGWKAKLQDTHRKEYRLGSVQEVSKYDRTNVILKGRVFKQATVSFDRIEPQDYFFINTGFPFGWASEQQTQAYLSAVSENLPSA